MSTSATDTAVAIRAQLRRLDYADGPVDVIAFANALGFEVRERPMREKGMTVMDLRTIFVRAGLSWWEKRWTVGHEIGHVLRGHRFDYARARGGGGSVTDEREADHAAAMLLMPSDALKHAVVTHGHDVDKLAAHFAVSPRAMAVRLKQAAPHLRALPTAPPQTRFDYSAREWDELEQVVRRILPTGTALRRATLADDYGGIDARFIVDQSCPLALRIRRDRPVGAPDEDVTWRTTEPAKMAAGTYAPLALFAWFTGDYVVAFKLIDVYRMAACLEPALADRPHSHGFHRVTVVELVETRALLWVGDRVHAAPMRLRGRMDTLSIIGGWKGR